MDQKKGTNRGSMVAVSGVVGYSIQSHHRLNNIFSQKYKMQFDLQKIILNTNKCLEKALINIVKYDKYSKLQLQD